MAKTPNIKSKKTAPTSKQDNSTVSTTKQKKEDGIRLKKTTIQSSSSKSAATSKAKIDDSKKTKTSSKTSEKNSEKISKTSPVATEPGNEKSNNTVLTQKVKKKKFPATAVFGARVIKQNNTETASKNKPKETINNKIPITIIFGKQTTKKDKKNENLDTEEVNITPNAKKSTKIKSAIADVKAPTNSKKTKIAETASNQTKVEINKKKSVQSKPDAMAIKSKEKKTNTESNNDKTMLGKVKEVIKSATQIIQKKKTEKPSANSKHNEKEITHTRSAPIKSAKKITVRYSDADLSIFKKNIEQQKSEILDEINSLNERIEDFNNRDFTEESTYAMHIAEQTGDALEVEKARNRVADLTDLVKKLNDALTRIENKTYGICRICNCLIAKERLLAVPVTTLSASYKLRNKCPEDGIDRIEKIK